VYGRALITSSLTTRYLTLNQQRDRTDQDHIDRKAHPFEVKHVDSSWFRHRSLADRPAPFADATEPMLSQEEVASSLTQLCSSLIFLNAIKSKASIKKVQIVGVAATRL
jgi:hypothetical protein